MKSQKMKLLRRKSRAPLDLILAPRVPGGSITMAVSESPASSCCCQLAVAYRSIPTRTARSTRFSSQSQALGEGAALRVAPELADPVGAVEVGGHEDMEQLGTGSRT
jgi:hypothetical protein